VCTLEPTDMARRRADWRRLLALVQRRETIDGGLRLHFPDHDGLPAQMATLAAVEQRCCASFDFSIHITGNGPILDVRAPRRPKHWSWSPLCSTRRYSAEHWPALEEAVLT
jgi:hypothetical protein